MIGTIVGDIVGSRFEKRNGRGNPFKSKDFDFFHEDCHYTDDTVITIAIEKSLLEASGQLDRLPQKAVEWMRKIGRNYPECGYGPKFKWWLFSDSPNPYNSSGNGSAMRVSGCAYAARSLEEAKALSLAVTGVTHNHPEAFKGAEAMTVAIYLARSGKNMAEIRDYIVKNYYKLDFTLAQIRDSYKFDSTCRGCVPQSLEAFFESTDFEDAIRNAVSLGGDSDTMAAITGSIAEAYYGVPKEIREFALVYLNKHLAPVLFDFEKRYLA